MDVLKFVKEKNDCLIRTRRYVHQHPELSWKEYKTTDFIEQELQKLGLETQRFEGHTGVTATIHGKKAHTGSKTIMLRADIDALPIIEDTGLEFSSVCPGVMHACGHDTHIAMLLTAAQILSEHQNELCGNVKLLFQGGEETAIGAKYYVDQGIMDGVDAVYGCHIATWLDAPYISVNEGPHFAGTDEFYIYVKGVNAHGGTPQLGRDAVIAASAIVMNLQSIVSRRIDSLESMVITVGKIEGGSNYNVVSGEATLNGTVRTFSHEIQAQAPVLMREVIENTAKAFGCTAELKYLKKTGPVIHDDKKMIALAEHAAAELYGKEILRVTKPTGVGDDFAYFMEKAPGIYATIGAANEKIAKVYPHHHAKVVFDETSMERGTAMFVQMAVDYLNSSQ